mmetsp:Transcript_5129/g.12156  ORF Transcript_5129/g.12156 Transcript_5129/m.12156 type:complete len:92 (+) Transcript_5129:395-670(+)
MSLPIFSSALLPKLACALPIIRHKNYGRGRSQGNVCSSGPFDGTNSLGAPARERWCCPLLQKFADDEAAAADLPAAGPASPMVEPEDPLFC